MPPQNAESAVGALGRRVDWPRRNYANHERMAGQHFCAKVCAVSRVSLLLPEWQGYGLGSAPGDGARALAARLFAGREVVAVDAPVTERLESSDRVLGLDS